MRGRERRSNSSWKSIAQSASATGSVPTIITPSPMFFTTRAPRGQRVLDRHDEPLEQVQRLVLALLLGEPHEPDQVGERDRHAQLSERLLAELLELGLHVGDHVLLDRRRVRKFRCR